MVKICSMKQVQQILKSQQEILGIMMTIISNLSWSFFLVFFLNLKKKVDFLKFHLSNAINWLIAACICV